MGRSHEDDFLELWAYNEFEEKNQRNLTISAGKWEKAI
jgi:hypothetical protein